ncbi:amidohydrolase family protein [Kitasatospora sp. NBC_01287]|uniref:amidohydrolase family protein n=1 Tax=Kitasatospora sp. NBC_01287 TaxID=2903573 RepID=UPI00225C38A3|nr:amidohydrolase family protein [Kitasatospora sp. NBC_01287]MCX4744097.1 amidohydrolase family protein [Kitasatospora sp. NBC_01287]
MVLRVRGVVLPEREERSFWIDGDRLRTDPVPGAETVVDGGWLLPGLVDVHTHPGTERRDPTERGTDLFSDEVLRRHLTDHRDAGVLLVRTPGTAARIPDWVEHDPELPRVRSAGRWLATPGRFFPGFGRDVSEADLVRSAVEEAQASSGWCKVIGDWKYDQPAVPLELLVAVVEAVHAVGGRVAVHCQTAEGCRNAVLAGADSLEHGMHLDPGLLDRMAAQGTALVPTLGVFGAGEERRRAAEPSAARDQWLAGWAGLPPGVRAAHEAGVTVLAGTDSFPCGTVAGEVGWLVRAGLPVAAAVGAASWTARDWLGLPGLVDGGPADLVAYATDPTLDAAALAHPSRIILRGRVIA